MTRLTSSSSSSTAALCVIVWMKFVLLQVTLTLPPPPPPPPLHPPLHPRHAFAHPYTLDTRRSGSFRPPPHHNSGRSSFGWMPPHTLNPHLQITVPTFDQYYPGRNFYDDLFYQAPQTSASFANCYQPMSPGTCSGKFRRFYFDNSTGTCREFIYTGCGGNGNNYENGEHCRGICSAKSIESIDRKSEAKITNFCLQPLAIGRCGAFFPRFFYNPSDKKCHEFIYSGCSGNDNNFYTANDCIKTCEAEGSIPLSISSPNLPEAPKDPAKKDEICKEPLIRGSCSRALFRFYFNPKTGRCEEFIYTGCTGNRNNFIHGDHCAQFCNASAISTLVNFNPHQYNGNAFWANEMLFPMSHAPWMPNIPTTGSVGPFNPTSGGSNGINFNGMRGAYFDDDLSDLWKWNGNGYHQQPWNGNGNGNNNNNPSYHHQQYPPQYNYLYQRPNSRNAPYVCYLQPDTSSCMFNVSPKIAYYYDHTRQVCQQYWYNGCDDNNGFSGNNGGGNEFFNDRSIGMGDFFSSTGPTASHFGTSDIPNFNTNDFLRAAASNSIGRGKNYFATDHECKRVCPAVAISYLSPSVTSSSSQATASKAPAANGRKKSL